LACGFAFFTGFAPAIWASPFVPIEWQQRVKSGPLEEQRKHVLWVRDLDQNFVDDALDAMAPDDKTTMIIQLSDCLSRQEIEQRFGAFGAVRHVGTLVSYVVLDNVKAGDAATIAKDPAVAAVEQDEAVFAFNDTSTRTVRARPSLTFSPETFADAFGFDGTGINVAVVDTGVDDAVHGGFAGKFVSGYNAITSTAGNPDDDLASSPFVGTGADGICDTVAAGDDTQLVTPGQGFPDPNAFLFPVMAILPGPNGVIDTVPGGDDSTSTISCDGSPYLRPGPDGICDSIATGDDIQVIPPGQGGPDLPGVQPPATELSTARPLAMMSSALEFGTELTSPGLAWVWASGRDAVPPTTDRCPTIARGWPPGPAWWMSRF
jgi:hypothetical protein